MIVGAKEIKERNERHRLFFELGCRLAVEQVEFEFERLRSTTALGTIGLYNNT